MNTNEHKEAVEAVAHSSIGAAMEVSRVLGVGFLEKVYQQALARELIRRGHEVVIEAPLKVQYKGEVVGHYFADLLVDNCLVIELKCAEALGKEHLAQCINYLRATGLHLALIFNFQKPKLEFKRVIYG